MASNPHDYRGEYAGRYGLRTVMRWVSEGIFRDSYEVLYRDSGTLHHHTPDSIQGLLAEKAWWPMAPLNTRVNPGL